METLSYAKWLSMRGSEELRELTAKYRLICRPERYDVFEMIERSNNDNDNSRD